MNRYVFIPILLLLITWNHLLLAEQYMDSTDYYYQKCLRVYNKTDNTSQKEIKEIKKACNWFVSNNQPVKEAWCYTLIGSNYYKKNVIDSAYKYFTKSLITYKKAGSVDSLATTYDKLANCQYYKGNFQKAKTNYNIGLIYPALKQVKASLLNGLAISYEALSYYDSALITYNKALDLYKIIDDSLGIAYTYTNIGTMYLQQDEIKPEAKEYLTKAYEIIKKTDNKYALSGITSNIAAYYNYKEEYQKSLENYLISYRIDSTLNDKFQIGVDLNNIGSAYLSLNDSAYANKFLIKALQMGISINAKQIISYAGYNLGNIELLNKNYVEALKYALISLNSAKESESTTDIIIAYNLLSKIYSQMGNYKKGFNYLHQYTVLHDSVLSVEKSKQLAEIKEKYEATQQQNKILFLEKEQQESNNIQTLLILSIIVITLILILIIFSLQLVKKNRKQIKEQQVYFQKLLSNSIEFTFLIDKNRMVKYVSPSYTKLFQGKVGETLEEAFYHNLDNETIEKSNELLGKLTNGQKRVSFEFKIQTIHGKTRYVTGVAQNFLDDNIIKGIIINFWDITNLKETSTVLKKREQELESSNQTKEKLFSIISHDLIGNIGTTSELMKLLDDNFENFDTEDKHKIISSVSNTLETTYTLVSNLLSWARIQMKKITTTHKAILLSPVIEEIANLYKGQLSDKAIEFTIACDTTTRVLADPNQLEFIIRNLVRNAIKFTHTGGKIWFSCVTQKGVVLVSIKDNGVGMDKKKINELLSDSAELTSTAGTNNEQGTGLGLIIVKEFIHLNKGKLKIKSKPEEGTEVIITFLAS